MKFDGRRGTPPRVAGDLARKAVPVGAAAAGVVLLVTCIALVLGPARGGHGTDSSFLGPLLAKSGHHSGSDGDSGGHHGKKHGKKHSKKHSKKHGKKHSDDSSDSGSGDSDSGDSDSGSDSGGSGNDSDSSGSTSGDSSGSSDPGTSTVSGNGLNLSGTGTGLGAAGGNLSGGNLSGTGLGATGSGPGVGLGGSGTDSSAAGSPGTVTALSCARVVTDLASMQAALAADPGQVICMQNQNQSGTGLGSSVGSALGNVTNGLGNSADNLGDATSGLGRSVSGAASKILTGAPKQTVLHTTGYSFQDNQGGDNATISCGTIHKTAGGDGTYNNPITVAVPGHAGQGVETPCGTRIYVPKYQKYFIVEDTGATKYPDAHHIDIYVDGQGTTASASKKCMDPVTTNDGSPTPAIINPPPGEQVMAGPITEKDGKCNVADAGSSSGNSD